MPPAGCVPAAPAERLTRQDEQVSATSLPAVVRRDLPTPSGPIAVLETGEGPAVLLVPGYTGSKEDFLPILPPLAAAGLRPVAMDQRGQFETPGPDDPDAYTVEALAADALGVVSRLGGRAHLVGHSFGGLVCRAATIAEPGAVASLTLLDSGPAAIGGERRDRIASMEPVLAAHGMAGVYQALEALARDDPDWVAAPAEHKAFLRRRFLAGSEVALRGMAEALRTEPDRTGELAGTGVPILVAYGEHDDGWPPPVQAEMAERLGAPRRVIPAAVHSPAAQQPAETARALLEFWVRL
jgi:pimeloyl-ACP methyl ester carboxylesterase